MKVKACFIIVCIVTAGVRAESNLMGSAYLLPTSVAIGADGDVPGQSASMFSADAWTLQAYGSGTVGDSDHGEIYTAHVGVGYFFVDDLSINLEAFGGAVETGKVSGDDDGVVGGFDLLFRWFFMHDQTWGLYFDGGAGFQQADTAFPSDSHYNFRPQFGIGAMFRFDARTSLIAGARYIHISNGATTSCNNGLDGAQLYAGLMWGF